MANISKVNFNGNNIDVKDAYAREQILHKTADNYTADVTGDYTINAGNKTETVTGDYTVNAGNKTETVTGTTTEKFANINTTVTGKWMVKTPSKSFNMADAATEADVTTAIEKATENFKGEDKYLIIADSYGLPELTGDNNWPISLVRLLHAKTGNYEIIAHGSIGFVGMVDQVGRTFESTMLECSLNKNEVTKIIIGGGANDLNIDADALKDAVKHLINTAKTNFPNATVYVAGVSYLSDIVKRTTMFRKIAECYSYANSCGGVYIPNVQNAILDTNLLADGVHPKKNGVANEYIADAIKCGLEGAYERTIYEKPVSITPKADTTISNINTNFSLVNNTFIVKCNGTDVDPLAHSLRIDFTNERNVIGLTDLGTYDSMFPNGGGLENLIPCYIICRTARNPVGNVYGALYFSANVFGVFIPAQTTSDNFNPPLMASTLHIIPLATFTRLY